MMLECNLKLFGPVLLFANASKSTHKFAHSPKLCEVAQGLHIYYIAIYIIVGVYGHDIRHILDLVLLYGINQFLNMKLLLFL